MDRPSQSQSRTAITRRTPSTVAEPIEPYRQHNTALHRTCCTPCLTRVPTHNPQPAQDHFWPPHAEANALLARIYSLVAGRSLTQINSAATNATVAAAQARIDAIVARQGDLTAAYANGTLTASSAANVPLNAEMTALLTTVQLQV